MRRLVMIGISVAVSVAIAVTVNLYVLTPPPPPADSQPSTIDSGGFYKNSSPLLDTTDGERF